jgi:hypothetical protein
MHWPAVRADVSKISAFRHAFEVKEHCVGVEKANMIEPQPSVEKKHCGDAEYSYVPHLKNL